MNDQELLSAMHRCLNTADGKILMQELEADYDSDALFSATPMTMTKNVAQRDLVRALKLIQTGEAKDAMER